MTHAGPDVPRSRRVPTAGAARRRRFLWSGGRPLAVAVIVGCCFGFGSGFGFGFGAMEAAAAEAPERDGAARDAAAEGDADSDKNAVDDAIDDAIEGGDDTDADRAPATGRSARSDDVFVPSEEISEDLSVAFPTDI